MVTIRDLQKIEGKKVAIVTKKLSVYVGRISNIRPPTVDQFKKGVMANVSFDYFGFLQDVGYEESKDGNLIEIVNDYTCSRESKGFPIKFDDQVVEYGNLVRNDIESPNN
jgi:hypothetical protein